MANLTYISDENVETTYRIGETEPDIMIGRHRTCNIRTSNQSVSRYHSRIYYDGNGYYLQDNESVNGTFYENQRLKPNEPVQLEDGHYLQCGNFEMRFDYDEDDHARINGGGAAPEAYEEYPPEEDESTRFAQSYDEAYYPPPPPPPPPSAPPPPPPPMAAPPPPPPTVEPARARTSGPVPATVPRDDAGPQFEGLRADLAQRDARIQEQKIEIESLQRRLDEARNDASAKGAAQTQLQADLDNARRAANNAIAESDTLRREVAALEGFLADAKANADQLRGQLADAASGSRVEDERHIAALQSELQVLRETLAAAQDKFEEARAGRRNAEELANLQRMRADGADAAAQSARSEIAQLKRDLAHAQALASQVSAADTVSAEEYDAQVAAREEAEARTTQLEKEVVQLKAQSARAKADAGTASNATIAELQDKLAAATARAEAAEAKAATAGDAQAADGEASRLRLQLKAEKSRSADLQSQLDAAVSAGSGAATAEDVQRAQADADAARSEAADLRKQLAAAQSAAPAEDSGELRAQVDRLTATNKELQETISANLKRIQRLTAQSTGGGGDSAALQAQVTKLGADLAAAQDRVRQLESAPPTAAAGGDVAPKVSRGVQELNGIVSSFRNDFEAVADAFEALRGGDEADREDAVSQMQEAIDNCRDRSAAIKNLVRDLRAAVEGGA